MAQGEAHTLFLVGTFAGLRLGDARRLEWRQVDAVIPLHPELAAELARVPPEQRQGFVMPKMATATANHVNEIVRRIFAAAGIKTQAHVAGYRNAAVDVGFHSLRVTFVSMMGNAGVPLALVQAMVGHMSPEMTMHYFRPDFKAAAAAVSALPTV